MNFNVNVNINVWLLIVSYLIAIGLGMLGMWGLGKIYPGAIFGVTTMRDRISNRLSEMRYRREQEMRRR